MRLAGGQQDALAQPFVDVAVADVIHQAHARLGRLGGTPNHHISTAAFTVAAAQSRQHVSARSGDALPADADRVAELTYCVHLHGGHEVLPCAQRETHIGGNALASDAVLAHQ